MNFKVSEDHQEEVAAKIKEEEDVVTLNVSTATNLGIWLVITSIKKKVKIMLIW